MDFDPSCLLSMSKDGWRKISAMHVTLKAGISDSPGYFYQAPVVRRQDNAIHWINRSPVDNC